MLLVVIGAAARATCGKRALRLADASNFLFVAVERFVVNAFRTEPLTAMKLTMVCGVLKGREYALIYVDFRRI